jgi:hypothetical protein
MNTLTVDAFCKQLKRYKQYGYRSAFLIGFDGTAALFGHSMGAKFHFNLTGELGARGSRVSNAWLDLNYEGRYQRLLAAARQTTLDEAAITCVGRLLLDGYVDVVLACDPHGYLRDCLLKKFPVDEERFEYISCATCQPQLPIFTEYLRYTRRLVIDTSDVLLAHLKAGHMGKDGTGMRDTRAALKTLLANCRQIICWGWCDQNWQYNALGSDAGGQELFVLGEYTECNTLTVGYSDDYQLVSSGETTISTGLLHQIGKQLFPNISAGDGAIQSQAGSPARAQTEPVILRAEKHSVLIWPQEDMRKICDSSKPLTVVGVDGGSARNRVACSLRREFERNNRECLLLRCTDCNTLNFSLAPSLRMDGVKAVIGCIGLVENISHESALSVPALADDLSKSSLKLVLVVPHAWLATLQLRNYANYDVRSLAFEDFLVAENVERLLGGNPVVKGLAGEEDDPVKLEQELAEVILTGFREELSALSTEARADLFHDALEFWLYGLERELQSSESTPITEGRQVAEDLWRKVLGHSRQSFEVLRPFDVEAMKRSPVAKEPADDDEDFEFRATKRSA